MTSETLNADGMIPATYSRLRGRSTCRGTKHMASAERRVRYPGFAASAVMFILLMEAVIASEGDPTWTENLPAVTPNRCSDYDLTGFTDAMGCGSPLSWPCFDFSRCREGGPTAYVYDPECSLADSDKIDIRGLHNGVRYAAKRAGVLADTYESACFFISVDSNDPQCATAAPLWNEGRNHVMFDLYDESRVERPSYSSSYAIEASTSQHTCYYRSGYDISIGHCPQKLFHELQSTPPDHRRYFLTFRGTLHIGYHGSEERTSIMSLHDEVEGIIVAQKCHKVPTMSPNLAEKCDELLSTYESYNYDLLMNSTFGLVPAGASPGTYRLAEVMSAGCIPVIVARDYVKPFPEEVDWSEFSFTFPPDEVPDMIRTLRSIPPEKLKQMQEKSLDAYWKMYGGKNDYSTVIRHVIDIVVKRILHQEN